MSARPSAPSPEKGSSRTPKLYPSAQNAHQLGSLFPPFCTSSFPTYRSARTQNPTSALTSSFPARTAGSARCSPARGPIPQLLLMMSLRSGSIPVPCQRMQGAAEHIPQILLAPIERACVLFLLFASRATTSAQRAAPLPSPIPMGRMNERTHQGWRALKEQGR
ncbi:uncharacterized protein K452DRAFT_125660 [Aplosporella prunicola CBS 121167]|uniref:Uncharacterized protein n=1 Tax=Aplosporella prunicola CBS 121167 TaxID=1176127 RepID=A0A6A6BNZ6_9PEZI|nr:uncharacterized protein K452DRAFT_125660 [Aplosporella prunicola CBS 121167]KAF2145796.1 hypothetical protein K452DRAFT_125660 [Aplosporella prunicola CBS 121167]